MNIRIKTTLIKSFYLLLLGGFIVSCASKKDVVLFQDVSNYETIVNENTFIPKFKVDDLISIYVSTFDPVASAPFNLYQGSQENGIGAQQVDYLVNKDGNIDFPVIGKVSVVGLSSEELREHLKEKLADYLKNPIINIRIKNFTVTVLGEVNRPGTYSVNGEEITILEALGLAGDMTIKGMRNNILVIRDFNGAKVYTKLDLTSKMVATSPAFYLTQNDVVIVEPNQSAVTASSLDNRANIAISIASVLITSTVILLTRN